jgi:hypothetical protein
MKKIMLFLAVITAVITAKAHGSLTINEYSPTNQIVQSLPTLGVNLASVTITNTSANDLEINGFGLQMIYTTSSGGNGDTAKISHVISNMFLNTSMNISNSLHFHFSGWASDPMIFINNGYHLAPGASAYLNISGSVADNADSAFVNSVKFVVSVSGTSIIDTPSVTITTHETWLKKCISASKRPGTADQSIPTPAPNTLIGTYNVVNISPSTIRVMGTNGTIQGSIGGIAPAIDFMQAFSSSGQLLGSTSNIYNNDGNFGFGFNQNLTVAPGDTAIIQIYGNVPALGYGDELSLATTFSAYFEPYGPWAVTQDNYVRTAHEAVGQKTVGSPGSNTTGIQVINNGTMQVSNTTNNGILFTAPSTFHVYLYDMSGRLVKDMTGDQSVTLSENTLPTGIYGYRMTSNSETKSGTVSFSR